MSDAGWAAISAIATAVIGLLVVVLNKLGQIHTTTNSMSERLQAASLKEGELLGAERQQAKVDAAIVAKAEAKQ